MEKAGIRKLVAENTDAMLAYWDVDQVCRYANNAYIKWFGKTPEDMIDKISLKELLKDIYPKNLPYIEKALQGETQVFYRDIKVTSGEIRRSIATYHPDIVHGIVKGFFVHVADLGKSPGETEEPAGFHTQEAAMMNPARAVNDDSKRMQAVAEYLRNEMFNGFPGLAEIAKKFFISVSKLKRDFSETYKTSPLVYYRNRQMEYAAPIIKDKKISKKELASLLNFSNPSNFSNYFRKFIHDVGQQRQESFIKKQSSQLNKIFIEQSAFAIAMLDINMNFLAVSQQWINDYGLQESTLTGRSLDIVLPELAGELRQASLDALSGKTNNCEAYFWKKADNTYSWLKWDIRPWHISQGEVGGILMFTQDITREKNQELSSHRASYILNKTSKIAKIGTWERDLITGKVTCNEMALEILETDTALNGSIAENLSLYKAGVSRKKMQEAVNESIHTGKHFDVEVEINVARSGSKWIRVIGLTEFNNGIATTLYGLFMEM